MLTLAVDTSSFRGSIALFKNQSLLGSKSWSRLNSHCELLTAATTELLENSKVKISDLNRLAVGIGPGSFTGIRVGLNFVRTLSYSLNIPVFQLNSLHLMASQVRDSLGLPVLCMQYGFRDLIYNAKYKLDNGLVTELEPPQAKTIDSLLSELVTPHLIIGSGFEPCKSVAQPELLKNFHRSSSYLDEPDARFFEHSNALDKSPKNLFTWSNVIPLYIRASEAEEKLKSGLLSPL